MKTQRVATSRLAIEALSLSDNTFMLELLNTEGWLKFIGNRNIHSKEDAGAYIQKIIYNPHTAYWVARLKTDQTPVGIITLIKREYLPHHDIGFAFLPQFSNEGYAYEAATAVLNMAIHDFKFSHMLATTIPGNLGSIKLLKKLGLLFEKEISIDNEILHVYGMPADKL